LSSNNSFLQDDDAAAEAEDIQQNPIDSYTGVAINVSTSGHSLSQAAPQKRN